MKCKRFHLHLNELLNSNTDELPLLAERHKEECARCEALHQTLISLQSVARKTPAHKLSRHSENVLIARITRKEGRMESLVPAVIGDRMCKRSWLFGRKGGIVSIRMRERLP